MRDQGIVSGDRGDDWRAIGGLAGAILARVIAAREAEAARLATIDQAGATGRLREVAR